MSDEAKLDDKGLGDVEFEVKHKTLGTGMTICRYVIKVPIYVGFIAVIYSICRIQHPDGAEKTPPISPTMQCVINLTVQFFLVYGLLWIVITLKQITFILLIIVCGQFARGLVWQPLH